MKSAPKPENEAERIRGLYELDILDTLEEQAYDDLTLLAAQICNTPIALVSLVDHERQWFKSRHGLDASETPREVAFCAHAILGDSVFVVEDSGLDERFHDNPLATGAPHVKFYAGAPLVLKDNLRVGTLCVIANEPRSITAEQEQALEALARQVVSQLELRIRVKELQTLDRSKDEFISTVSHELRSPLTSINGSLSLLMNNKAGELQDRQRQMVEIAARNSERLLGIVNDILDLAKLEAGKLEIDRGPCNLVDLLENALELNRPYCTQCNCHVVLEYEECDRSILINCDEHRMLQVLTNLLTNAAKYSRDDEDIEVSLVIDGDSARIEVTDHGPGIPEDQQQHVFERFKQIGTPVNQKMAGTGLGLRISKQLIELHDGTIGFRSIPGESTTFYLTLPLAPASRVKQSVTA
ncbi:MAG: GAF domain-containing sensor histidine kinase [Halobacteria archaeon]|nr:GAF domain-containing sensor histidine kinase [Halobacteria archaeon]